MKSYNLEQIANTNDQTTQDSLQNLLGLTIRVPEQSDSTPFQSKSYKISEETHLSSQIKKISPETLIRKILDFYCADFANCHQKGSDLDITFEDMGFSTDMQSSFQEFCEFKSGKIRCFKEFLTQILAFAKGPNSNLFDSLNGKSQGSEWIVAEIEMSFLFLYDLSEVLKLQIDLQPKNRKSSRNLLYFGLFKFADYLVNYVSRYSSPNPKANLCLASKLLITTIHYILILLTPLTLSDYIFCTR